MLYSALGLIIFPRTTYIVCQEVFDGFCAVGPQWGSLRKGTGGAMEESWQGTVIAARYDTLASDGGTLYRVERRATVVSCHRT